MEISVGVNIILKTEVLALTDIFLAWSHGDLLPNNKDQVCHWVTTSNATHHTKVTKTQNFQRRQAN